MLFTHDNNMPLVSCNWMHEFLQNLSNVFLFCFGNRQYQLQQNQNVRRKKQRGSIQRMEVRIRTSFHLKTMKRRRRRKVKKKRRALARRVLGQQQQQQ